MTTAPAPKKTSFRRLLAFAATLLLILLAATPGARAEPDPWPALELHPVAGQFARPTHITHAGDGSGRLFVVEQAGLVRILKNGVVLPAPFLDISGRVGCCGERGLLSLAFPPDYVTKRHFYVNYTDAGGATVIARFHTPSASPNQADPASEEILLRIVQPFSNHNGGQIAFGPADGYLYIGMGDGGDAGDPHNNGQRTDTLLGKLLRIDVEAGVQPYAIPAANPFTQTAGYRGEIWALGLRNPWRFSFDRLTADLYIADVGQGTWEEIDFQPAGDPGGQNYGWRLMEGAHCFNPAANCDPGNLTAPVAAYPHTLGCSVSGGHVYRGSSNSQMAGIYFYADYCSGRIWGLKKQGALWQNRQLLDTALTISTFGEDEAGELYLADYGPGDLYHVRQVVSLWLPLITRPAG